jgi:hypothetical protein
VERKSSQANRDQAEIDREMQQSSDSHRSDHP